MHRRDTDIWVNCHPAFLARVILMRKSIDEETRRAQNCVTENRGCNCNLNLRDWMSLEKKRPHIRLWCLNRKYRKWHSEASHFNEEKNIHPSLWESLISLLSRSECSMLEQIRASTSPFTQVVLHSRLWTNDRKEMTLQEKRQTAGRL
jgi:hypothetical protein